jgi:hypothetical protein
MPLIYAASSVLQDAAINITYINQEQSTIDALLFLFQNKNGGLDK